MDELRADLGGVAASGDERMKDYKRIIFMMKNVRIKNSRRKEKSKEAMGNKYNMQTMIIKCEITHSSALSRELRLRTRGVSTPESDDRYWTSFP